MIQINLLPRERPRRAAIGARPFFVLVIFAAVVLALFVMRVMDARNARLDNRIKEAQQRIQVLQDQVRIVEALRLQIETARKKEQVLKTLQASRVPWDTVLEEFRAIVPKDVWLNQMSAADDGALIFDGFGLSYEAVARLMVSLGSSKMFKDIDLTIAQKQMIASSEVVNFSVTGRLTQERKEAVTR